MISRHEVFVRFRLCPLSAHDKDGDIGGEAGQAGGEPRDILQDVDDVITVRIPPSLEAVDAHDGGRPSAQLTSFPPVVGVSLQGPCRCRRRRLWGSTCRRCSVYTCVFVEEQGK